MPRVGSRCTHGTRPGDLVEVTVDDRAILALEPADHRVRVHLVMPGIDRTVDITASPAAAVCALEDAAARARIPTSRVHAELRRRIGTIDPSGPAWRPGNDTPAVTVLAGVAFPLLAAACDAGAEPPGAIPPWATGILAAPDPRTAARIAFADKATRPVIAALARSLVRTAPDTVDLSRLALALAGRGVLEPDRIAAVLVTGGTAWPTDAWPTTDGLARAAEATRYWGAERTFGYLCEAAADDTGRERFTDAVVHAVDLGPHAPTRLPTRLGALIDLYRLQVRTAPATPTRTRPPAPAVRIDDPVGGPPRRAAAPDDDTVDHGAFFAPPTAGDDDTPVAPDVAITPPPWLTPVEGTSTGDGLGFVLAHRAGDLIRWGRTMANCLDTYRRAAAAGASHLVGITRAGHLRYVVEITPSRRIRQFSGRANRPVPRADHDRVVDHLRALRILT